MSAASEERWRDLLEQARESGAHLTHLVPLLTALVERPAVTRFFPFTSLGLLCLSASSDYPFVSRGLPSVGRDADGRFVVSIMEREPWRRRETTEPIVEHAARRFEAAAETADAIEGAVRGYPVEPFVGSACDDPDWPG